MREAIDHPIAIHEGFFGRDSTSIMPVKRNTDGVPSPWSYIEKSDEQISICCYYLQGYIEQLLNKYYSVDIQLEERLEWQKGYEEFGWNFYTPEQMKNLLNDLETYMTVTDESIQWIDFYARFIGRMRKMLHNMDGYDLILFCGP